MNEIKEKLLEKFKNVGHKCAQGNCDSCKYSSFLDCNDRWIIDIIMDEFIVAEKLQDDEIKQKLNSIYGKSSIESIPKPITDVIFVEDGSVDTDELQKQFGDNVPIIIYRQGGVRPEIKHLECPITPEFLKKETESK